MKAAWHTLFGICPKCGHRPNLNPLRALLGAVLVLAVLTGVMAFAKVMDRAIEDGIVERMDARVAQDANN